MPFLGNVNGDPWLLAAGSRSLLASARCIAVCAVGICFDDQVLSSPFSQR